VVTYAIVESGGKQYNVESGDTIRVEYIERDSGDKVEIEDVLMLSEDGKLQIGSPVVAGAKVTAEVVGQGKAKKVTVFKYKAKTRYRRKNGHRQFYTDLLITDISAAKKTEPVAKKTDPATKKTKPAAKKT
jgi:large subunit ribosomal protein L21